MAECVIAPYLDQIGPSTVQVRAAFRVDQDVTAVSFSWHTYSCMQDQASLLELGLDPGLGFADVTCTLPVEKVTGFADAEPIRFELKCGDAEIWGGWYRAARVDGDYVLVPTQGDISEQCRL